MGFTEKIEKTLKFIRNHSSLNPSTGIVLGTGLGSLVNKIQISAQIPYDQIPYFPKATATGHKGVLIFGKIAGKNIVAMDGRFHFYEGYSMQDVTYPVRVLKALGCNNVIISNASGGMNPKYKKGDIVVITDHINLMGVSPLIGQNEDRYGPRFPDMSDAYSKEMIKIADQSASELGIELKRGIYSAVTGPNLETPAEYRFLRIIGADLVGMSTVPEVIVARHQGTEVLGLSVVTDIGFPGIPERLTVEEVIKVARETEPKLTQLVEIIVSKLEK